MLSLETCKRLRASGLKQGVSMMLWCPNEVAKPVSRETCAGGGYCDVYCGAYCIEYDDAVDCYNSDELIAAIQARWDFTDIEIEKAGTRWWINVSTAQVKSAETMLAALAELYITLSAQGD